MQNIQKFPINTDILTYIISCNSYQRKRRLTTDDKTSDFYVRYMISIT